MNEKDSNRLLDLLDKEWNGVRPPNAIFYSNLLKIYDAARAFRETDELRYGDKVQVKSDDGLHWEDGVYIGKVTEPWHYIIASGRVGEWSTGHFRLKPKTEKRLKDSCAIMHFFDDNGWLPDKIGVFRPNPDALMAFYPAWWQFCECKIEDIPPHMRRAIPLELFEEVDIL